MLADPIVIAAAARTPMGGFQGALAACPATRLGAIAIEAALARSGLEGAAVDEALMGNVLSAGLGQAPARQAALGAGDLDEAALEVVVHYPDGEEGAGEAADEGDEGVLLVPSVFMGVLAASPDLPEG